MEHYDGDIQEQFETWWFNEGSNGKPAHLDCEEFVKQQCNTAWLNGAYCAEQNLMQPKNDSFGIYVNNNGKKPL